MMGFLLTGLVAGCGSGGDGGGGTGTGTATLSMTDAPACGYEVVNVTVSKVRIHQSDSASDNAPGWTDITLNPPQPMNLLDLNNGALASLGETPLTAGHYTQLRLVLDNNNGNQPSANWIVLEGQDPKNPNNRIPLDTPSAIRTGIKLIHQFTVNSGQRVDLLLDFDACKSIVKRGNGTYALKPVIQVVPFEQNGIVGFVATNLLGNNVVVSAQVSGEIVRATVPNTTTGKFFLAHLVEQGQSGTFDVVITADSHATAVISGVPVPTSTSITDVSASGAPIPVVTIPTLEASQTHSISGTVTLNPLSTTDETVFVAAKQTLNSGPTVTVKSQVAVAEVDSQNNLTGNYSYALTLPIGAPSFGPYATPLPIVFTRQPASVAGIYTAQASATGYAAKSSLSPVNISGGDAINQDFTLTP
ncbi:MAG: DUF4382 domain-containing protein [Nitrospirota bacterium]|nr:DUF4382 domain-containing protein [Nitrospirota bacterium]